VLGIDTSSEVVSLALAPTAAGLTGAELTWPAGRTQTATLLAQIDHLLRLSNIESDALGAVVIATGPGGFNALRVGMSVAKGFAFALGIPIFGVGTLDIAAQSVAHWGLPVRAFVPAGRRRAVFADYTQLGGRLQRLGEIGNRQVPDLAADLTTPTVLVGDLTPGEAKELQASPNAVVPPAGLRRRRAAFMIDLALPRWEQQDPDDLMELEPLYIHQQSS
jgi:tRNA threonylcarbamoyladenosine biosynthesis protein TsaB